MADILPKDEATAVNPLIRSLSKIFYYSFEFSQGSPDLQHKQFLYLHNINPEWKIGEEEKAEISRIVLHQIENRFFGGTGQVTTHAVVNPESVYRNVKDEIEELAKSLNRETPVKETHKRLVEALAIDILNLDLGFIRQTFGRPRKKEYGQDSKFDPWMSHLQYYTIAQNPVSTEEYQVMFKDIREWLLSKLLKKEIVVDYKSVFAKRSISFEQDKRVSVALSGLAMKWEEKHPGRDFFEGLDLPDGTIVR